MEIYGLFDELGELRYVGKTVGVLTKRLIKHLSPTELVAPTHKNNWIKQLLRYGAKPQIRRILALPPPATLDDLDCAEIYWIAFFRAQGCRLTNGTNGGDGMRATSETKEKMSESAKLYWASPEHRAAQSIKRKGSVTSAETRYKQSVANLGKERSAAHCANISLAKKGTGLGRPNSLAARSKISDATKAMWADPKRRAAMLAAREAKKCSP